MGDWQPTTIRGRIGVNILIVIYALVQLVSYPYRYFQYRIKTPKRFRGRFNRPQLFP